MPLKHRTTGIWLWGYGARFTHHVKSDLKLSDNTATASLLQVSLVDRRHILSVSRKGLPMSCLACIACALLLIGSLDVITHSAVRPDCAAIC